MLQPNELRALRTSGARDRARLGELQLGKPTAAPEITRDSAQCLFSESIRYRCSRFSSVVSASLATPPYSLYFACLTGISLHRRVLPRLRPPPLSLPEPRLSPHAAAPSEKNTRFRGVLGDRDFPRGTGDPRFGAQLTSRRAFVSVPMFGGSLAP